MDLETASPEDARDAYTRAIALDPRHAAARVNLGRMHQEAGRAAEAATEYRAALRLAAEACDRRVQPRHRPRGSRPHSEAIDAYRKALDADQEFADAHFNLSRLYEQARQAHRGTPAPPGV